jgi:hypothetical protein
MNPKSSDPADSDPSPADALSLAKVQLPPVGVSSPSSGAAWKSPKSPKLSKDVASSICSDSELVNVKGSEPLAAAESENGPNVSSYIGMNVSVDAGNPLKTYIICIERVFE